MQIRKFNWYRKATSWDFAQARQAQTRRVVQGFAENAAATAEAFTGAQTSLQTGLATISVQRLIERSQAELKAKSASISKLV